LSAPRGRRFSSPKLSWPLAQLADESDHAVDDRAAPANTHPADEWIHAKAAAPGRSGRGQSASGPRAVLWPRRRPRRCPPVRSDLGDSSSQVDRPPGGPGPRSCLRMWLATTIGAALFVSRGEALRYVRRLGSAASGCGNRTDLAVGLHAGRLCRVRLPRPGGGEAARSARRIGWVSQRIFSCFLRKLRRFLSSRRALTLKLLADPADNDP
jgi:hypothetical protein